MADYNIGTIGANVVLDKKQWDQSIASLPRDEQAAGKSFKGIEKKAVAVTAAFAAAGAAMARAAKGAVKEFIAYEDAADTFAVVFEDQAKQVRQFAEKLSGSSRRGITEILSMMGEFQTMLRGMGSSKEEATEFTKAFSQLAVDLSAFWNKPLEEGIFAFESAMYGRTQSLRRMGLAVSDATLKERALATGMKDMDGEATSLGKTLAILSLAKEQLSFVTGNAARSAYMFKERLNGLKNVVGDVGIEIGKHMSKALNPFTSAITELVTRIKELMQIYPAFGAMVSAGVGIGGAVGFGYAGVKGLGLLGIGAGLTKGGVAAGAVGGGLAFYGVKQMMDALALPEVRRMFQEMKQAGSPLPDLFYKLGRAIRGTITTIASPVSFGQRLGEAGYEYFRADDPGENRGITGRFKDAFTAFKAETIRQRKEIARAGQVAADALGGIGDSVKEAADEISKKAEELRARFRPEVALSNEFKNTFLDVLGLNDPAAMRGFAAQMQGAYRELDEGAQTRFRLRMNEYGRALDSGPKSMLSEIMGEIERPDLTAANEAAKTLFSSVFEAIAEGAKKRAASASGLLGALTGTADEYKSIRERLSEYAWSRYDRQQQVGEARETPTGGIVAAALSRAMGGIQAPASMSPQERELMSIREAQYRSVELQARLVTLQEQLNFLMQSGGMLEQATL